MARITYATDDDEAAKEFINRQLRSPEAALWAELLNPERAQQTWRVLRNMSDLTQVELGKRREAVLQRGRERARGLLTPEQHEAERARYEEWKAKAEHFRTVAEHYMRRAREVVYRETENATLAALHRAVNLLATAIAEHRERLEAADYEPTDSDRMLWARLATVQVPKGSAGEIVSAGEYIHLHQAERAEAE